MSGNASKRPTRDLTILQQLANGPEGTTIIQQLASIPKEVIGDALKAQGITIEEGKPVLDREGKQIGVEIIVRGNRDSFVRLTELGQYDVKIQGQSGTELTG